VWTCARFGPRPARMAFCAVLHRGPRPWTLSSSVYPQRRPPDASSHRGNLEFTMNVTLLLQLASFTYLGLLAAGLLMPRVVGLREHLRVLPKFIQQLVWVYYSFIGLCLVSFGLGTFLLADQLASGTPLARAICGFLAVFWTARFVVGTFVFDLRAYLT